MRFLGISLGVNDRYLKVAIIGQSTIGPYIYIAFDSYNKAVEWNCKKLVIVADSRMMITNSQLWVIIHKDFCSITQLSNKQMEDEIGNHLKKCREHII